MKRSIATIKANLPAVADGLCLVCCGHGVVWRNSKTFAGKTAVGWQEFCQECGGSGCKPEPAATDAVEVRATKRPKK